MATPTRTAHQIPGAAGDIRIEVCSTSRSASLPAVIYTESGIPFFADRLARAGLTAVCFIPSGASPDIETADLHAVIAALETGSLGVSRPSSIALVEGDPARQTGDELIARLCRELR